MKIPQFLLFIMSAVTLNAETANFDADLAGEAPEAGRTPEGDGPEENDIMVHKLLHLFAWNGSGPGSRTGARPDPYSRR